MAARWPLAISAHPMRPTTPAPSVTWLGVTGRRQSTWRVNQKETFLLMWRATKPRAPPQRSGRPAAPPPPPPPPPRPRDPPSPPPPPAPPPPPPTHTPPPP